MRVSRPIPSTSRGFSLVELLLVMTVIVILIAVAGPALRGLLGSDNRKAAVSQLMGALEQARATALEKGVTVSIGFAGTDFKDKETTWQFARYIIFRERSADLGDKPTDPAKIMITKWQALPVGVVLAPFGKLPGEISETPLQTADGFPPVSTAAGGVAIPAKLHVLSFNSAGAVVEPAGSNFLNGANNSGFFITQGFYTPTGNLQETRRAAANTKLQYDRVTLARYTGRARLDPVLDPR